MNLKLILDRVRSEAPLVHCITNGVTINDCANIVLACGGSPTMAQHPGETAEIAAKAASLVLNMGNVSAVEAMLAAGKSANSCKHPIILDPVGVGSSHLRRNTFKTLSDSIRFSVIRGNATEIRYLATGTGNISGVDAAKEDEITEDNAPAFARMAMELAARFHCVIAISGVIDIVADSERAYTVHGGCYEMSRITGTGCMLTAMIGAFIGANPDHILEAVLAAQACMNTAGSLAKERMVAAQGGTMTLRLHLIDRISLMTGSQLEELAHVEELPLRNI